MKKPFVVDSASHVDELKAEIASMRPVFRAAVALKLYLAAKRIVWTDRGPGYCLIPFYKLNAFRRACDRAARKAKGKAK